MAEEIAASEPAFVLLGTVTRPHGIKGELKVRPYTARPENFSRYSRLYLSESEHGPKTRCVSRQARVNGNQVILRLDECSTRNQAEEMVGHLVWLATEDLPALQGDEFYLHTLIGKDVQTVDGRKLGRAEHLLSGSEQDIPSCQARQRGIPDSDRGRLHSFDRGEYRLPRPARRAS